MVQGVAAPLVPVGLRVIPVGTKGTIHLALSSELNYNFHFFFSGFQTFLTPFFQEGFQIAEEDVKIRGPGDFLGTRQSGLPELRIADIIRDYKVLQIVREEAFQWLEHDPQLKSHPPLRETLIRRWGEKLALAAVG